VKDRGDTATADFVDANRASIADVKRELRTLERGEFATSAQVLRAMAYLDRYGLTPTYAGMLPLEIADRVLRLV
jgi:hypothetical protein